MSDRELGEHAGYVTDAVKIDAYRRALESAVSPGDVVIDLGCGTGLLGMLALEAGAGQVVAVDSGPIIELALEAFAANGMADRVRFHRGHSRSLRLDRPADVVVCDQIGGFGYEVGLTAVVRDLRDRGVIDADTIVIPAAFDLLLAPVFVPDAHDPTRPWHQKTSGFDFGPFARSAANTPHRITIDPSWLLGPVVDVATLDATDTATFSFEADLSVTHRGRLTGLAGAMRAHLDRRDGVTLTNDPSSNATFRRWHLYHPVAQPVDVEPGAIVRASFVVNQAHPVTNWTVTVDDRSQRMSSFVGEFVDPTLMFDPPTGTPLTLSRSGLARRDVLDAIDRGRSFQEAVDVMIARYPDEFLTGDHARRFVREMVARFCEPLQSASSAGPESPVDS